MGERWTAAEMPPQTGRIAVVTGANSGLGLATVRELAAHGATVVMACRDLEKGRRAAEAVAVRAPEATLRVEEIDLGRLDSIRAFAERFTTGLDLLINNAGVMAPPRQRTSDGFELQLGTNHLGHFALTGLLLPRMQGRGDARVVTLSSTMHRLGRLRFDDLQHERRYFRWTAYGQSKLANLMFALELDRRLRADGSPILSVAAHPGYAATHLGYSTAPLVDRLGLLLTRPLAQSDEMGALPTLYAATHPDLPGGAFVGPDGPGEQRGHPRVVAPSRAAQDVDAARRLWEASERLTGVRFELSAPAGV